MRTNVRLSLVVLELAVSFGTSAALAGAQAQSANSCLTDLQAIPAFLLANDAGARDHLAQLGQKHFDDAMAEAQKSAAEATTPDECAMAINKYLRSWRKGHLWVELTPQAQAAAAKEHKPQSAEPIQSIDPTYRELSPKTILLTLPTFHYPTHDKLEALLKAHHEALANHPNWIIDVRDNNGGTDANFQPLLPWLLPGEMVDVGMVFLATPANIQGRRESCAVFAPGDKECEEWAEKAVEKMEKVPAGSWVAFDDQGGVSYDRVGSVEQHRPSQVAVLIDHPCGSSCEQFVLVVRQSFAVKTIGRHTFGSLDYSNLIPYALPSGNLRLWYATSRTLRIPGQPVDVAGISFPIFILPAATGPRRKTTRSSACKTGLKAARWLR